MSLIKILDAIKMDHFGARVKDASDKLVYLHKQQGSLDGACAVYSTIMDLLILGYLKDEDLQIYNPIDSRTSKGKFLQSLFEDRGLVREGFSYTVLTKLLKDHCPELDVRHRYPSNNSHPHYISQMIDDKLPVIISVTYSDNNITNGHALVCIGYECDTEDRISKLLCLDPGYEVSKVSAWNCFIEIPKSGYKCYLCGIGGGYECELGDLIVVQKK
ncbi:MAG: hypothetical protein KBT32_05325 [Bacteroidales bacterium]|nr:hypothetical protein [Candidatus Physcocola equi]